MQPTGRFGRGRAHVLFLSAFRNGNKSSGFSPYPVYMPPTPMAATSSGPPSAQMRPPLTPGDMSQQQAPGPSHMHNEQQQVCIRQNGKFFFSSKEYLNYILFSC